MIRHAGAPRGVRMRAQPMVQLRLPSLFNLRSDPLERAQHEAGDYVRWSSSTPSFSSGAELLGRAGHGQAEEPAVEQLEHDTVNSSRTPPTVITGLVPVISI